MRSPSLELQIELRVIRDVLFDSLSFPAAAGSFIVSIIAKTFASRSCCIATARLFFLSASLRGRRGHL
jgi:hypothetical protein